MLEPVVPEGQHLRGLGLILLRPVGQAREPELDGPQIAGDVGEPLRRRPPGEEAGGHQVGELGADVVERGARSAGLAVEGAEGGAGLVELDANLLGHAPELGEAVGEAALAGVEALHEGGAGAGEGGGVVEEEGVVEGPEGELLPGGGSVGEGAHGDGGGDLLLQAGHGEAGVEEEEAAETGPGGLVGGGAGGQGTEGDRGLGVDEGGIGEEALSVEIDGDVLGQGLEGPAREALARPALAGEARPGLAGEGGEAVLEIGEVAALGEGAVAVGDAEVEAEVGGQVRRGSTRRGGRARR